MTDISSLEPSIALAAYAEPLATGRRALVFGSATGSLAAQLVERGARAVHVCDPEPLRVAEAIARNRSAYISFSPLAESELALREKSFDLVVIDNLGAFNAVPVLQKAKRALSQRGVAVVACPNPEAGSPLLRSTQPSATALDYYALYDAVAAEFEHVRMLGQTPFVGYAIADFSASGEPEPALDTGFVPGGAEEPDLFIALCAAHEVKLEEFSVIQLPTRQLLSSLGADAARVRKAEKPEAPPAKPDTRELDRLNQWIKELEARASTADSRADEAEASLEELKGSLEELKAKLDAERQKASEAEKTRDQKNRLERELTRLQEELKAKSAESTQKSKDLEQKAKEVAERDRKLADLQRESEQGSPELTAFEQQLAERGGQIRKLEGDLRTAERTGRELVRELERRRTEQSSAGSAELEKALAEREADLQAAAWTIESLSLRLELAGSTPSNPEPSENSGHVGDGQS